MKEMDIQEIKEIINQAIEKLRTNDGFLLDYDVNERTISCKLASYLQEHFDDYDVDCEYNRDGHEPKRLNLKVESTTTDDVNAKTVYPDIIIHNRGSKENIVVIEIKKGADEKSEEKDVKKLQAFKEQLKYKYAIFLNFRGNEYDMKFVED